MNKNPLVAFAFSFIPGAGHFYLNRSFRGTVYMMGFLGFLFLAVVSVATNKGDLAIPIVGLAFFFWIINMIDMVLTLIKRNGAQSGQQQAQNQEENQDQVELSTVFLSFIPGLGHLKLGLMNRGLTFLVSFFGLMTMIFFVAFVSHQGGFLVFIGLLPIIWIYSIFDVYQQLSRKQKGEPLIDRTILEDLEGQHGEGRKSKPLAILLSIFPGAGHLYLGLQKRGIQLMAAFLFSIYILDVLRISAFLFLIPLIWFYSFFDGLQKISKHGEEKLEDEPIISYFINHQKWVGIILIVFGLYYIVDSILLPMISPELLNVFHIDITYWYHQFFQTGLVCLLLIGGGIKLLTRSKVKREVDQ